MQVYRCKVRLAGNVQNEVPKIEVTAAEIIVLRHLHGEDAVVDIKPTTMDKRSHEEERDRLSRLYTAVTKDGVPVVEQLFGPSHRDLPIRVPGLAAEGKPKGVEALTG